MTGEGLHGPQREEPYADFAAVRLRLNERDVIPARRDAAHLSGRESKWGWENKWGRERKREWCAQCHPPAFPGEQRSTATLRRPGITSAMKSTCYTLPMRRGKHANQANMAVPAANCAGG